MSTILGVHDGHNGAAAVLKDGRIVAAVQEERLTRSKNEGGVPHQAICDVLKTACVDPDEINMVALDGTFQTYDHWDRDGLAERYEQSRGLMEKLKQPLKSTFVDDLYKRRKAQDRARRFGQIGFEESRLAPVDHHMAHAAAYYGSGWRGKVLILARDGSGDRLSATVNIGEKGQIQRIVR